MQEQNNKNNLNYPSQQGFSSWGKVNQEKIPRAKSTLVKVIANKKFWLFGAIIFLVILAILIFSYYTAALKYRNMLEGLS